MPAKRCGCLLLCRLLGCPGGQLVDAVEVGKRSYGLYLWSWPIFVIVGATEGSVPNFVWAMVLTVAVSEASYRYLETPVRTGAVGRWWNDRASITYWPPLPAKSLVEK